MHPGSTGSGLCGYFLLLVTSRETLEETHNVVTPQFPRGKNKEDD